MNNDLMLPLVRAIREDVADLQMDVAELNERLVVLQGGIASVSRRTDRIAGNVDHVKRRLGIMEGPAKGLD